MRKRSLKSSLTRMTRKTRTSTTYRKTLSKRNQEDLIKETQMEMGLKAKEKEKTMMNT
jgi:hypothetical protein